MLAALDTNTLIAALGLLGGLGGVTAFILAPRQASKIAVEASSEAVRALNDSMATLRADLRDNKDELERYKKLLRDAKGDRDKLERKVGELQGRVESLEGQLEQAREYLRRGELPPSYSGEERRRRTDPDYGGPERRRGLRRKRRPSAAEALEDDDEPEPAG